MKKRKLWLLILPVVLLAGVLQLLWVQYSASLKAQDQPSSSSEKIDQFIESGVPNVKAMDFYGKDFDLSDYKDKTVIINFWASWCDPCIEEFPSMIKLVEHFKGEVVIVAISADRRAGDIENFLKAFKVKNSSFHIIWDKDAKWQKAFGTEVLPESYILGRENKFVRKVAGVEEWYHPQAISFFEHLLSR